VIYNLIFAEGVANHIQNTDELVTVLTIENLGLTMIAEQSEPTSSDVNGAVGNGCFRHVVRWLIT
jgi:hypothetical protein